MKTPLAALHAEAGARFIEFAGWEMPVHYGSQIEEHHAVRNHAGCFDVSHMAVVDIAGQDSEQLLRRLLVCDVSNLDVGCAAYTLMLNERGGIVDDLIAYRRREGYRLVVNAGTKKKDLEWIARCGDELNVTTHAHHRSELCIIAIQGQRAVETVSSLLALSGLTELEAFNFIERSDYFVARTGYTGEDGVEVICPSGAAVDLWSRLVANGIQPVGLGARDSLRLEAGLNLYGHDMSEDTNPFECRVAWTIDWNDVNRRFIGRQAIEQLREQGATKKLVGLKLIGRGIPREGFIVETNAGDGVVTSGTFSPSLKQGIALARLPRNAQGVCHVIVRQRQIAANIVRLPFIRRSR
ncbi:MAG: glycine cleavage system aminomethyltransferase GcvT [Gammaproteobacteria bacterium]|nr:glycine cleavage system aminomethyltransferase GcvT [Gammaproteobacteria bacterium]